MTFTTIDIKTWECNKCNFHLKQLLNWMELGRKMYIGKMYLCFRFAYVFLCVFSLICIMFDYLKTWRTNLEFYKLGFELGQLIINLAVIN